MEIYVYMCIYIYFFYKEDLDGIWQKLEVAFYVGKH